MEGSNYFRVYHCQAIELSYCYGLGGGSPQLDASDSHNDWYASHQSPRGSEFFGGDMQSDLNAWDKRLIGKYLGFYQALDGGSRSPATKAQAHFVLVCRGKVRARTQHEVAYVRYLANKGSQNSPVTVAFTDAAKIEERGRIYKPNFQLIDPPTYKLISIVDCIEGVEFEAKGRDARRVLRKIAGLYRRGFATARNVTADASFWVGTLLADNQLANGIERWTGSLFGGLSNIYTQAMDGNGFLDGLKAGSDYISPWIHRVFEGHTLCGSWDAVCNALPDDTFTQEVVGWIEALTSDVVTRAGLPITGFSPDQYEALKSLASNFNVPEGWLRDSLTYTGAEIVQAMLPGIAIALNWKETDAEEFAKWAGHSAVGAVVSGNPILAVIAVALMARAHHLGKYGDSQKYWAKGLARGGLATGTVLAGSALIGGPASVGLIAGVGLYFAISKLGEKVDPDEVADWLRTAVEPCVVLAMSDPRDR